jgi:hypothetical protein
LFERVSASPVQRFIVIGDVRHETGALLRFLNFLQRGRFGLIRVVFV